MVRINEHEAKQQLKRAKICTPLGDLASTPEQVETISRRIGVPVIIKAQIPVTGRLKAGGIEYAGTPSDAYKKAKQLLGKLIKGFMVDQVLVEKRLSGVTNEFFMAVTTNASRKGRCPLFMFSSHGGTDIETIASKSPEEIVDVNVDYLAGIQRSDISNLISKLGIKTELSSELAEIACKLYQVYTKTDAHTVEINPLALTTSGDLVALDCRIDIDGNAVFRQPELGITISRDMIRLPTELEQIAWRIEEKDYRGTGYFVQLISDIDEIKTEDCIAFHGVGGGGSMVAIDAFTKHGLCVATYADNSGNPPASKVYRISKILLSLPVKGYCYIAPLIIGQDQRLHGYALVKALREEAHRLSSNFAVLVVCGYGNGTKEMREILEQGLMGLPLHFEIYEHEQHDVLDLEFFASRMSELMGGQS